MNELLGFLVLSAPLVFIVLWIVVGLPIAFIVSKRLTDEESNKKKRLLKGLIIVTAIFLLPFADAIVGRIYFNFLCHYEGGPTIYKTVDLPIEYWDEKGIPKFNVNRYERNKMRFIFDDKTIINASDFENIWTSKNFNNFFKIDKDIIRISDKKNKEVLGEYILFRKRSGWFVSNFTPNGSATSCKVSDLDTWSVSIFKPIS